MKERTLNDYSIRSLSSFTNNGSALQLGGKTRFRENLGTFRGRASLTDEVTKDEANTYVFRLRQRTNLSVNLENRENLEFFDLFGTKKRVQARLFGADGDVLDSTSRIRPEDDDEFRIRLNPGTYSIRITGRSENEVEYQLNLRTSNNDSDDDFDFDDD